MATNNKEDFKKDYALICPDIKFIDFSFDEEQFKHLKYRCEDILSQIKKSDIKKTKLKKICQEMLHSKKMKNYFDQNPNEKNQVVRTINENSIKRFKPSVGFLPSYLIHDSHKDNVIKSAIDESYFLGKKRAKDDNTKSENKNKKNKKNNDDEDEDEVDKKDKIVNKKITNKTEEINEGELDDGYEILEEYDENNDNYNYEEDE